MATAVLELHYLPCIQYFSKLLEYPTIIIEQQETYQKGSYRNRCHIATANGLLPLSIPLSKGKNQQQNIQEVRIDNSQNWQNQHWRAIQSAYGKSPFFEHYMDDLKPFYQKKYPFLLDWNKLLLEKMLEIMALPLQLQWTSEYQATLPPDHADWRKNINPKSKNQITDPHFLPRPYPQAFLEKNGFLPNLSILDLLFCTGPQAIQILEESSQSR